MNRQELIAAVAKKTGLKKIEASNAVEAVLDITQDTLKKGGTVSLMGWGTFKVAKRAARKGVNPKTGTSLTIKARTVVRFTPGSRLKKIVKNAL